MLSRHSNLLKLVAFNANVQLAHWQADTLSSVHQILGSLYDDLVELTDALVEVSLGSDGNTVFEEESFRLIPNLSHKDLIQTGLVIITEIRGQLKEPADSDALNILADIQGRLNRAKYLLKV